nr:MAG TPA: hypothetical protein [Caudoviricetes sp.]
MSNDTNSRIADEITGGTLKCGLKFVNSLNLHP